MIIPAITLWQPWATLIAIGSKPYETRPKHPPKKMIGQRIAIHASARRPRHSDYDDETFDAMCDLFNCNDWMAVMPLGVVVCTTVIESVHRVEDVPHDLFGDYTPGRSAWKLTDTFPVIPHIAAKGKQLWGWPWDVPPGLEIERKHAA